MINPEYGQVRGAVAFANRFLAPEITEVDGLGLGHQIYTPVQPVLSFREITEDPLIASRLIELVQTVVGLSPNNRWGWSDEYLPLADAVKPILSLRFGLADGMQRTKRQTAEELGITVDQVLAAERYTEEVIRRVEREIDEPNQHQQSPLYKEVFVFMVNNCTLYPKRRPFFPLVINLN